MGPGIPKPAGNCSNPNCPRLLAWGCIKSLPWGSKPLAWGSIKLLAWGSTKLLAWGSTVATLGRTGRGSVPSKNLYGGVLASGTLCISTADASVSSSVPHSPAPSPWWILLTTSSDSSPIHEASGCEESRALLSSTQPGNAGPILPLLSSSCLKLETKRYSCLSPSLLSWLSWVWNR